MRSWFQRQQTCPTCRLDVLQTQRGLSQQAQARQNRAGAQNQRPNQQLAEQLLRAGGPQLPPQLRNVLQNAAQNQPAQAAPAAGVQVNAQNVTDAADLGTYFLLTFRLKLNKEFLRNEKLNSSYLILSLSIFKSHRVLFLKSLGHDLMFFR